MGDGTLFDLPPEAFVSVEAAEPEVKMSADRRRAETRTLAAGSDRLHDAEARRFGIRRQRCTWCGEDKLAGDFGRNPRTGWITRECRSCEADRLERWAAVDRRPVVVGRRYVDAAASHLLCKRCGRMGDDPDRLLIAVAYLKDGGVPGWTHPEWPACVDHSAGDQSLSPDAARLHPLPVVGEEGR